MQEAVTSLPDSLINADVYPAPRLYIAGEWRPGGDGIAGHVRNPVSNDVLAEVPRASPADLDEALDAAKRAFPGWRRTSAIDRGDILSRAALLLRERADRLARMLTLEQSDCADTCRRRMASGSQQYRRGCAPDCGREAPDDLCG